MKSEIEKAVKVLAAKITDELKAPEALNYTQAILNLMHALSVHANTSAIK